MPGQNGTMMDPDTLLLLAVPVLGLLWFGFASLWAWLAFARDKRCAVLGQRRLPEGYLLRLAWIGGWPGAKLAQRKLRHKTFKQPFARRLNLALAGPVLLIGVLVMLAHGLAERSHYSQRLWQLAGDLSERARLSMASTPVVPAAPEDGSVDGMQLGDADAGVVAAGDADAGEMAAPRRFGPGGAGNAEAKNGKAAEQILPRRFGPGS